MHEITRKAKLENAYYLGALAQPHHRDLGRPAAWLLMRQAFFVLFWRLKKEHEQQTKGIILHLKNKK